MIFSLSVFCCLKVRCQKWMLERRSEHHMKCAQVMKMLSSNPLVRGSRIQGSNPHWCYWHDWESGSKVHKLKVHFNISVPIGTNCWTLWTGTRKSCSVTKMLLPNCRTNRLKDSNLSLHQGPIVSHRESLCNQRKPGCCNPDQLVGIGMHVRLVEAHLSNQKVSWFMCLTAATLHVSYLSLFSCSDRETALALVERSIICLERLINTDYVVVLTLEREIWCCLAIWGRCIKPRQSN